MGNYEVEQIAYRVRKEFNIDLKWDYYELKSHLEKELFPTTIECIKADEREQYITYSPNGRKYTMYLRLDCPDIWKKYSLIHCLGHLMLYTPYLSEELTPQEFSVYKITSFCRKDIECTIFANEFIAPRNVVASLIPLSIDEIAKRINAPVRTLESRIDKRKKGELFMKAHEQRLLEEANELQKKLYCLEKYLIEVRNGQ